MLGFWPGRFIPNVHSLNSQKKALKHSFKLHFLQFELELFFRNVFFLWLTWHYTTKVPAKVGFDGIFTVYGLVFPLNSQFCLSCTLVNVNQSSEYQSYTAAGSQKSDVDNKSKNVTFPNVFACVFMWLHHMWDIVVLTVTLVVDSVECICFLLWIQPLMLWSYFSMVHIQ